VINDFKKAIHRLFNAFGLEVRFIRSLAEAKEREKRESERQVWRLLRGRNLRTILDIGANEGQFAGAMRREFPGATIYSFEPLPDVFQALVARFDGDEQVVPVNVALSDHAGVQNMHRSEFSPSSSLLPMSALHKEEFPWTATHSEQPVSLVRLDDWAKAVPSLSGGVDLVKMDVQGYELAVISGGLDTIRRARLVISEVSFHELYEGQALFADIHERLRELGFRYCGNLEQYFSERQEQVLFADALFENTMSIETRT
jgi:FkbM family methyltransferase